MNVPQSNDVTNSAKPVSAGQDVVRLFWTGGWDSTFRLLQLLLFDGSVVQPYYLIDAKRRSTEAEMATMDAIRARLYERYVATEDLLRPTQYAQVAEIDPDAEIEEAFRAVMAKQPIGSQYEWLARYCKQHGIDDMELCIHRDDQAHGVLAMLAPSVEPQQVGDRTVLRIAAEGTPESEYALFGYFQFPVFRINKLEMAEIAREHDWMGLMNMTWFCHRPKRGKPCGRCRPCLYAVAEGLGWRIPAGRRAMSRLHRTLVQPVKRTVKALKRRLRSRGPDR